MRTLESDRLRNMVEEMDNDRHVLFDECLEWDGHTIPQGYPHLKYRGKLSLGHRLIYEWFVGPIEPGMDILHTCDNPRCVNPAHLFQGTHSQNMADMAGKGRNKNIFKNGEGHRRAKLSNEDVKFIRESDLTLAALGEMFGVHFSNIGYIKRGKTWKELTPGEPQNTSQNSTGGNR